MSEIKKYLTLKKRNFTEGKKLYKKYGQEIVPDFDKYKSFFDKVDDDNKMAAQGILDSKLNYILRLSKQKNDEAKKKDTAPKVIRSEDDLKTEAKALRLKEQEEAKASSPKEK